MAFKRTRPKRILKLGLNHYRKRRQPTRGHRTNFAAGEVGGAGGLSIGPGAGGSLGSGLGRGGSFTVHPRD
jgi:hypothetical protein